MSALLSGRWGTSGPVCRWLKRNQKRSLYSLTFFAYSLYLERNTHGLHIGLAL